MDNILKNFTRTSAFNVKDSFEAADKLRDIILPDGYRLISFDVTSLFTNVKKNDVIRVITNNWDSISLHTKIPLDEFIRIIVFLFDSSYFKYNEKFFSQISGCAMGNSASPTLANLVMDELLEQYISQANFVIPYLQLFIDDINTAVPEDKIDDSVKLINSINDNLKFTYELEKEESISFLDLKLIRRNNKILIDHYRKPMSSNRILNWFSYHPLKQKLAIITQMITKIKRICSPDLVENSLNKIREVFKLNNYPEHIIRRAFQESNIKIQTNPRHRLINRNRMETDNQPIKKFIKAPYHHALAPRLKRIFNKDTQLAFYNTKTNEKFFGHVKDKIPKEDQAGVVYKLECDCGSSYVGQTNQRVKKRIYQHKNDIKKGQTTTGLSKHMADNFNQHQIDWKSIKILESESNWQKRSFLEMFHVKKTEKSLNIQSDFKDYNNKYNHLIKDI